LILICRWFFVGI